VSLFFRFFTIFTLIFSSTELFADTLFASPEPSVKAPRKVVIQASSAETKDINNLLNYANNIIKGYGGGNVSIAVVALADGIDLLKKDRPHSERVKALMSVDVEFFACLNTMESKKLMPINMLDDIYYVRTGFVDIIERVKNGWIYISP
jgi:uncharacterized protein